MIRMIRLIAALLVAACLAAPANAQDTLTVTSQYGPEKPQSKFWERFAALVESGRPGVYKFNIVTNGALGGEKEEAEGVRLGSITGALSTVANLTTWVPEGAVLDLPFVFSGRDQIMSAMKGPLGKQLRAAYREQGFETPAFIIFGARHLLSDRPLTKPEDVKGLTMRVLESDLHIALWRSLGANPTALPITETYTALGTGVVEAMDLTKSGYEALKLFEVAPVLSETAHIWAIGVVYFDRNFWESLPEEDQKLFESSAQQAAAYFNKLAEEEQDSAMTRAIGQRAQLVEVDQAPWREAVAPFVQSYVSGLSPAAMDAYKAIEAAR
ncbi:ABC transporter substrate-binding protein [Acuticoccus sediminis]|uniref:ABC transporter substrate-binding protein n=1 Tax=Acuticoccus sediminis TaxID=2184697 RepID=A0A8B2NQB0_9HYPH|nr:TRAP transporter substrate-binding protein [Acuticoccus sediminis]RAI00520.1 ABC transporter substrate-binding protein [Acuticoccus sediminis]